MLSAGAVLIGVLVAGCGDERVGETSAKADATPWRPSPQPSLLSGAPPQSGPLPSSPLLTASGSAVPEQTGLASGTPVPQPPEPVIGPVLRITSDERVALPLDPYMSSMEELKVLALAQQAQAVACMRALGFTRWVDGTVRNWDEHSFLESDFYEYLDPEKVRAEGYPRRKFDPELMTRIRTAPKRAATADEMGAFSGYAERTESGKTVPPGGCDGQARAKVYGDMRLPVDARSLSADSETRARTDSRVRAAVAGWRACVARDGLDYSDPFLLAEHARQPSGDGPASDEEKRVAGIDATCQNDVNLTGIYKTVQIAIQKIQVEENRDKLIESRAIFAQRVEAARALLK
ncbi:hypothetical protein DQ384_40070 [Sphaerisporangium album]|uniref:Uncharacterized protein n=1 Tax=Sphaerisporangium album TaxID=509200 RepID=A0A367EFE9_9ACTN|nr:hypothetical protein DQ384_40070 [Sphaerisporangium album]